MNEVFNLPTIIIFAVAIFIFLKLRSVLGTRNGNEQSFDPFNEDKQPSERSTSNDNVVPLPGRNNAPAQDQHENPVDDEDEEERKPVWQGFARKGSAVARGIEELAEKDASFTPKEFLSGARMAYEMIVSAFAEGDKKTLKPLLSKEVFEGFSAAIDERTNLGQTLQSQFVGINKADISKVKLEGKDAKVSIKFVSDLITATLDKDGEVVDGDPTEIQEITDVWTFERSLNSRDPNWRLIATEAY